MRKWIIGIGLAIAAAALGVGAAYGGSLVIRAYAPQIRQSIQSERGNSTVPFPAYGGMRGLRPFGRMRNGARNWAPTEKPQK